MEPAPQSETRDDAGDPAARCFVHILPSELLCHVFGFLVDYGDRIRTATVCHFWRDASLSSPALLWSDVVSQRQKLGVLTAMLARTNSVPARLTVTVGKANVLEVSVALKRHLCHLTYLSIHIGEHLDGLSVELAAGLATPAPILKSFIVMDIFLSIETGFDRDFTNIFSGNSPRLYCLKLFSDVDNWRTAPFWPELRSLLFSPTDAWGLDTVRFNNDIALAKSLKTFGLDIDGFEGDFALIRIPTGVETLAINIGDSHGYHVGNSMADFVAHLDYKSLRLLTLLFPHRCDDDVTTRLANDLCSRFSTDRLTIYSSLQSDDMILEGASKDGRIWEMFDVSPSFTAESFARLRSLSLSDSEWMKTKFWPIAPVLHSLEIRLIAPCYMQEDGHKSLFLDIQAGGVLHCPQVETVCFSSAPRETIYCAGFDVILAPEMITDFLRFGLEYPRSRRPDLHLRGVKILEFAVDHVMTLLSCVGDIRVGCGYLPHQSEGELFINWEVYGDGDTDEH